MLISETAHVAGPFRRPIPLVRAARYQAYANVSTSCCAWTTPPEGGEIESHGNRVLSRPSALPDFLGSNEERDSLCHSEFGQAANANFSGGEYNPAALLLKIDKGPAIHWPHKEVVKIENLDLKERHQVVLFSDGKRIQSFWFRFDEFKGAEHLCISFDGYQGVNLQQANPLYCKCKSSQLGEITRRMT